MCVIVSLIQHCQQAVSGIRSCFGYFPIELNSFQFQILRRPLKLQTGGAAVWLEAKARDGGLGLRPRLYVGSVCDDSAADATHAAIIAQYKYTFTFLPYII